MIRAFCRGLAAVSSPEDHEFFKAMLFMARAR